jgi:hypothetical protein
MEMEIGTPVMIIDKKDKHFQNGGLILAKLDEAYYNLVVEFPNGSKELYKTDDLIPIEKLSWKESSEDSYRLN